MKGLFYMVVGTFLMVNLPNKLQAQWLLQPQNFPDLRISFNTTDHNFPVNMDYNGRRFLPHRPGLTGAPNSISFESIDFPGRYLRHTLFLLYAHYSDGSDLFKQDATFIAHENRHIRGYYSFESSNYPSFYLRHKNYYLQISNATDEYWEGDTSFRFLQQNIMLQPRTHAGCEVPHCKISKGSGDQMYVQDQGQPFHMVSPALNGQRESVSFEDASRPGYYLRDYAGFGYIDFPNNTRSPSTFSQDASFYLRYNRFSSGFYGIESAKYNGRFLRSEEKLVTISREDGSTEFPAEASFRIVEGPVYLESQNSPDYKIAINSNNEAILNTQGTRWNLVYPGLTGHHATLSIESFDKPGFYLRHFEAALVLEDQNNPRNPGLFNYDASYIVRKNFWYLDYIVMESVNFRNQCIRHDDNKVKIATYESDNDNYKGDASYKITEAPLYGVTGPDDGGSGANVGAIVGGIFGLLLLVLLIVGAIFLDRKFAWTDTVKRKIQGTSTDTSGGVDNPSYNTPNPDEEQAKNKTASASTKPESTSTMTSSPPTTPTTPTADPFVDTGSTQSTNPVKRLGRRLSDSMSKLRRSSSTKSNDDRRIEVPESFDLSVQDFQPGYDSQPQSKGSFDNPMYGLQKLSQSDSVDGESGYSSPLNMSSIQRHDSLIDASPTLTAVPSDFDQAMNFYDQTIESHDTQEVDLGDNEGKQEAATNDPVYASIDKSKKRISANITPITEDDVWVN